jgi:uroporphyrinogen-III decarboxylase
MAVMPSNEEKERLWQCFRAGRPDRVPVHLSTTDRVYILDPQFNREGLDYPEVFARAEKMLLAQLRWQETVRTHHHQFCDLPAGLPDAWSVGIQFQNVYEAWYFGCEVRFEPGQVPDTRPMLTDDIKRAVFDVDIDHPLERDPFRRGYEFTERMTVLAQQMDYRGRPVQVRPYIPSFTDGPLTVATDLRGTAFLTDLYADPDYADELLAFLTQAAINRAQAVAQRAGKAHEAVGMGDDMLQAISTAMYVERILPLHRRYYDALDPNHTLPRSMHLCGDATRHMPIIARELGVRSFDTGFPVDFGALRRALGPEVELWGGVEVAILLHGSPQQVYARARDILTSGVLEGRRFVLRDANNLPPRVPMANLEAMYKAAFDFGRYA